MPFRDSDYEGLDDREFPDPDDEAEGGADTVPCPYCHRHVYEGAEVCPHCQSFLIGDERPTFTKPLWVVVVAVFLLFWILVFWI